MTKWLFLTVGAGNPSFEGAAIRLGKQVERSHLFDKTVVLLTDDVIRILRDLSIFSPNEDLNSMKGFGWYSWKPRIAYLATSGYFGNYDGVMYLDSGCEFFNSFFSRKKLLNYKLNAIEKGITAFAVSTPETHYTKSSVLKIFPDAISLLPDIQFQSGSWFLFGSKGREFARRWESVSLSDLHLLDATVSPLGESPHFVSHRHDQSIFSLVAKQMKFSPELKLPPGSLDIFSSRVRGFFYPFAWARNLSSVSKFGRIQTTLGSISLLLSR